MLISGFKTTLRNRYTLSMVLTKTPANRPYQTTTYLEGDTSLTQGHAVSCSISANNDWEAIAIFLAERASHSEHTALRYRRECTRFLAWLELEQQRPLLQLRLEHLHQYKLFLQNPPERWRKPGLLARMPSWTPFPNPVQDPNSLDAILAVIGSLLSFLHAHGYIRVNPGYRMKKSGHRFAKGHQSGRGYTQEEWQFIRTGLEQLPRHTQSEQDYYERMRYLLAIGYGAALREHELCSHTHGDIIQTDLGPTLKVLGKGAAKRHIVLNQTLVKALKRFRLHHGAPALPVSGDRFPLAPPLKPVNSKDVTLYADNVGTRMVRKLYRHFIQRLIVQGNVKDTHLAESLLSKSFHSLRHTSLSHLANQPGTDLEKVRLFAGHSDINTTKGYLLTELSDLAAQTRHHFVDFDS